MGVGSLREPAFLSWGRLVNKPFLNVADGSLREPAIAGGVPYSGTF